MKKGFKFVAIFAVFFGVGLSNLAASPLDAKTAVGVYAMSTVSTDNVEAYGLELQQWITPKLAFTIVGAGFYDEINSRPFNANLSLQLTYSFIESRFGNHFGSRFFGYALAGYSGYAENKYDYVSGVRTLMETNYVHDALVSLGFGFEFLLIDHISIPVTFGFAGKFPTDPKAGFCLGIGARYAF